MEGNSDNAQTALSSDDNGHEFLIVVSRDDAYMTENLDVNVAENVANDAELSDSITVKTQTILDVCEDGHIYVKSAGYDPQPLHENVVSESEGFINDIDTHAFEENTVNENPDDVNNAINESCEFEENSIGDTHELVENVVTETRKFEETTTVDIHGYVDSTTSKSITYEEHRIDFAKDSDIHNFSENTEENTGLNIDKFAAGDNEDVQTFMKNSSGEACSFVNDDGGNHKIFRKEDIVQHQIFRQDSNGEDRGSTYSLEGKASMENESSETHSNSDNSKVREANNEPLPIFESSNEIPPISEANDKPEASDAMESLPMFETDDDPQLVVEVIDNGKMNVREEEFNFDLKYFGPVTGRRSYRSDVGRLPFPAHVISERLRPTAEPSVSRDRSGSAAKQNDGVEGRKRKLEEMSVQPQVAKRKKMFPLSLLSYLSYLSPSSLLSLLRPSREDVVLQSTRQDDVLKEALLTDESDEESE